ncbi:MAG: hypothetical protein ACRC0G_15005, partial [Fusobacteriaceae bacterium]
MESKNNISTVLRYIMGLGAILIGVLGILETGFFVARAKEIIGAIMLISALDHIAMIFKKENDYFNWKMVLLGTLGELALVIMIFFFEFPNKEVIINISIGAFLSVKGVILIVGNREINSTTEKSSNFLRGIVFIKGLFLFLIGALTIILPVINGRTAMVFGWYILFLGINFISYPLLDHYRKSKIIQTDS